MILNTQPLRQLPGMTTLDVVREYEADASIVEHTMTIETKDSLILVARMAHTLRDTIPLVVTHWTLPTGPLPVRQGASAPWRLEVRGLEIHIGIDRHRPPAEIISGAIEAFQRLYRLQSEGIRAWTLHTNMPIWALAAASRCTQADDWYIDTITLHPGTSIWCSLATSFGSCSHHSGDVNGYTLPLRSGRTAIISLYSSSEGRGSDRDPDLRGILPEGEVVPWSAKHNTWEGADLLEPTEKEIKELLIMGVDCDL